MNLTDQTPLSKLCYDLGHAIEALPASEQATLLSIQAGEVGDAVNKHELDEASCRDLLRRAWAEYEFSGCIGGALMDEVLSMVGTGWASKLNDELNCEIAERHGWRGFSVVGGQVLAYPPEGRADRCPVPDCANSWEACKETFEHFLMPDMADRYADQLHDQTGCEVEDPTIPPRERCIAYLTITDPHDKENIS